MACPIGLDKIHHFVCLDCFFWEDGGCHYEILRKGETHSEEHYCPVCKGKTTFIGRGSWGFCSRCGYKEERK